MDELIRELEAEAEKNRTFANEYLPGSDMAALYGAYASICERHVGLARAAKRRMAEHEPAWDLQ